VAPDTAVQENVIVELAFVIKLPAAGAVLVAQPGTGGGGGGLVPPFLLQEFTSKASTSKQVILFLKFISSY
ncbi:MAG: hypothetical protein WAQ93_15355, partial [Chitinophagaceae bacterium]